MSESESVRTHTLARIVGPFLIALALTIFARYETLTLLFPAFFQDGILVLITGVFTLIVGLVMFAAHHHWTGWTASIITLLAIVAIIRGAVLMIAPDIAAALVSGVTSIPPFALIASAFVFLLGAWLTFVGWFARQA